MARKKERPAYVATVTRAGKWWAIEVPGTQFGHTQARHAAEVEHMARDLIACMYDVAPDSFDLAIIWPAPIAAEAARADAARAAVQDAQASWARAVSALRGQGLSVRETAALLHLSASTVMKYSA